MHMYVFHSKVKLSLLETSLGSKVCVDIYLLGSYLTMYGFIT